MSDGDTIMTGNTRAAKRRRTESPPSSNPVAADASSTPEDSSSSDDDGFGPSMPPPTGEADRKKTKKRRTLPKELEKIYLEALPTSARYSRSLMHRDTVVSVTMTPFTDFLITTSVDGVVKFWKKTADGIEFVKMFRAHREEIVAVDVSSDGRSFACAGLDGKVVIFDVVTFDLLATIQLKHPARTICWVHRRGSSLPMLAVSDSVEPTVAIYDGRGENPNPLHTVEKLHRRIVHLMAFNDKYNCVISCDDSGMVEYWSPRPEREFSKPDNVFEFKSETGLFDFKISRSVPTTITISPTQESFATFSFPDRKLRVFEFRSAKLVRAYNESLSTLTTLQQASTSTAKLADIEFGRRMALESGLDAAALAKANVVFDETGSFIIYGTLAGIKMINLSTNKLVRTLGRDESMRPLNIAVYQGAPQKKGVVTVEMAASANPLLQESEARDPTIFCTALGKPRFYIFTNDSSASKTERDVLNEKPRKDCDMLSSADAAKAYGGRAGGSAGGSRPGAAAIIHTSMGDIHLRLFPEAAPKTVENFVTHARNGYYNGTTFHRVIKKFMIQGGDPNGDGTGGESIWGGEFEDEFSTLKHDKPYTLSSANYGKDTNGSQFFITTDKTPWLDGIHTIFGRATQGLDVIHKIENVRTYKEKPEEDIKIINISVL